MKGTITEEKKFTAHLSVGSYQVDARQLLRPSAFMDLAQEMAYQTSEAMHFGFADLQRHHFVWVLARMQIRFHRRPKWGEEVDFDTWCKRPTPLFFLRDFQMKDAEGKPIVEATTSWTVIDIASRKMVRGEEVDSIVSHEWICEDSVFENQADKVMVPKDAQAVAEHKVAYSDIDVVGHANNSRYLSWAMDMLDHDYLTAHELREVTINFNHECRAGQTVSLSQSNDGDCWFVAGQVNGRQAFAVEMKFE